ncbi:MAG: polyprenyl synthetase family protein [Lactobacillales bacterium]|jgi:geranylgeranyl diphosphate synthase type II|nr:polyprenyl synthetase family protein [Lactobacillales bacterium]
MKNRLQEFQHYYLPLIEDMLQTFVEQKKIPKTLQEAMLYSLMAGGKRLRPLLTLMVITSVERKIDEDVIKIASVIELIHTYSLIHDDLPAMDNDDFRRGKLTNHKVYGDGIAILAGDALLTLAFQILTESISNEKLAYQLVKRLSVASGALGMVAGQILDLQGEDKSLPLDAIQNMHRLKTGALFIYSVEAGLLIAQNYHRDFPRKIEKEWITYAESLGLAFQIRDDILDITQTTENLGKTAGKDVTTKKSTYPSILGLSGAKKALTKEIEMAYIALKSLEEKLPHLNGELLHKIVKSLEI